MSDLRAAVERLPSCECNWMDLGEFLCICGNHNARPYRDNVVHMPDGRHARRDCAVLAIIDAHRCIPDEATLAAAMCATQDYCDGMCPDFEGAFYYTHGFAVAAIIAALQAKP